jgi:hypothetical protein
MRGIMSGISVSKSGGRAARTKVTSAPIRRQLQRKLLSLGGSSVVGQGRDPHAQLIAARGELFPQRVRLRRGEPHRCHANAAELWATATDRRVLATGYALSGDRWVSHSWVVDGKALYETAFRFDGYFGAALPPLLAFKFWFENVYAEDYPDRDPPPGFWESRPGIVALVEAIGQLPREEFFRRMTAWQHGVAA